MATNARPRPGSSLGALALGTALAIALLSGCGLGPPSVAPPASAAASPATSALASRAPSADAVPVGECRPEDLRVSSQGWGAAAGSRGADVAVESAAAAECDLPPTPVVRLLDAGGRTILATPPTAAGGPRAIGPGESVSFSILVSNWCDASVALPVSVLLDLGEGGVPVVGLEVVSLDDLPPCNGPGQPPGLVATPWETS